MAPIFLAVAPSPSLVAKHKSTGLPMRKWLLQAIVTEVSVMALANFARVLPVHGATTMISHIFFGPMGSASTMDLIIFRPQISSISQTISLARPKRVSVLQAFSDIIGSTVAPCSFNARIWAIAFSKVQKEPHSA